MKSGLIGRSMITKMLESFNQLIFTNTEVLGWKELSLWLVYASHIVGRVHTHTHTYTPFCANNPVSKRHRNDIHISVLLGHHSVSFMEKTWIACGWGCYPGNKRATNYVTLVKRLSLITWHSMNVGDACDLPHEWMKNMHNPPAL
jgi:hypothetical protein